ncbi:divergent polysaccharide deacetylase family protein [Jannaschia sp. M317]|uniref:divergent polysaccharide deacetylase family protein n=1 Tax=Jannaschia sp. M317 TaxID=2867011 RepID=UPI0021A58E68|nr:divergent polysaccharide deacetylase family protein [Jannaschia sp. M317]UWQ16623.1 divergent polysaccharide deacetylase family protein [Jannaschia sp. M317]
MNGLVRGLLLGGGSALALSAVLLGTVSLLTPSPDVGGGVAPPPSAPPAQPVIEGAEDSVPQRPDPLPDRVSAPETAAVAPTPEPDAPAGKAVDATAPTAGVPLPAGSQFNRPREDLDPIVPGTDADIAVVQSGVVPPGTDAPATAPTPDTATAGLPQASQAIASVVAPEAGEAPLRPSEVIESAPQTFREIVLTDEAPDNPNAPDPVTEAIPAQTEEPPEPIVEPAAPDVTLVKDPLEVDREEEAPEEQVAPTLPRRIILDSAREVDAESVDASAPEEAATPTDTRALLAHAAPFENPEGLPLFSIILIDDPDGTMPRETLLGFDFPVTFAVDPSTPGANEAAATYRAAGYEVLMLADALALRGGAQDVEIALAGAQAEVPEAVGVLDRAGGGFASNRSALAALLPPLEEAGMGFVAYGTGLNTAVNTALREGVPAQAVYRVLDEGNERATVITRFLDRATFEAAQDGSAIVVGRSRPETVTALFSWALGRRSDSVAVAPISHLLRAAAE